MRIPALLLAALLVTACASVVLPTPLTGADIVMLARSGKTAPEIIEELKRTDTVLPLLASDYVTLHDEGVPDEVLDYLQLALINDVRWRERAAQFYWYGPMYRGMGPCPGPYRRGPRGC
jgi:hypothetical protein